MSVFADKITFIAKVTVIFLFIISGPLVLLYNSDNKVCPHYNTTGNTGNTGFLRSDETTQATSANQATACQEFTKNLDYLGKGLTIAAFITALFIF
jgi:hypothetical protein